MLKPIENADVAAVFQGYPSAIRQKMMTLRKLIFDVAEALDDVGELDEVLKWGQPAYVTARSKSGTPVRLGWRASEPSRYALHVHCQTDLIARFRVQYPFGLTFDGNRSIVFEDDDDLPHDAVSEFVAAALTYHRDKKRGSQPGP